MKLTVLAGGVGAARLLSGLAAISPQDDLTVIVNTGDDFRWMGLYVCPDLDTIVYTLAGLADPLTGWGVRDDTFDCLERLRSLGCETWFRIGDRDLATHLCRTHRLAAGFDLSQIVCDLCGSLRVAARILPMTDTPAPTRVHTDQGTLDFQDYFVRRACAPNVQGFDLQAAAAASPASGVLEAIRDADSVIVCPSNPYISIAPILTVPGIRDGLRKTNASILAISPIVAGQAIKGPAAAMMRQLGEEVSAATVARLYRDFLDIFVLDCLDELLQPQIAALGLAVRAVDTVMDCEASRIALAKSVIGMLA